MQKGLDWRAEYSWQEADGRGFGAEGGDDQGSQYMPPGSPCFSLPYPLQGQSLSQIFMLGLYPKKASGGLSEAEKCPISMKMSAIPLSIYKGARKTPPKRSASIKLGIREQSGVRDGYSRIRTSVMGLPPLTPMCSKAILSPISPVGGKQ